MGAGMRHWSTAGTSNTDPFGSWRDDLAQAFVRLEPRRLGDMPFAGRIAKAEGGVVQVSRVDASAHAISRRREHIARSGDDVAFVNLQIAGIGVTRQHGREVRTAPFDIALADTAYPFEIAHAGRFALYSITVPRAAVPAGLMRAGHLRLSAGATGRRLAALLGAYADLALDAAAAVSAPYGRHIVDLLDVASRPGEAAMEAGDRAGLLRDYVGRHFRDPALSARSVAAAFGISERYVHKLFAHGDESFSDFMRSIRLDACARDLGSGRPITAIALDAGFSDLSYFNRTFRARFGETPSAYRRRLKAD